MTNLDETRASKKSVQEVSKHKRASFAKSDSRYWGERLFRNTYTRDGQQQQTADWCMKLAYAGRRETINLRTSNKQTAAAKAATFYRDLVAQGWNVALVTLKPEAEKAPAATVGALIAAATRLSSTRPESINTYAKALRRITAGIIKLGNGRKYDFKRGSAEWRAKVDATPLDRLTPAAVLAWKNCFLKASSTPEERGHAAITINSLLRNSKALMSKRIAPFIKEEISLPAQLWFDGITAEPEPSLRYKSKIDAGTIIANARKELAESQPEAFKLLLLTLVCGLRRSEADTLLWRQVDFERAVLSLHDTEVKRLKSKDSAGDIGLDAELVAMLRGFHANAKGDFVLETPKRARLEITEHKSNGYRCDATQKTLLAWLRKQGVPGLRPLHVMRKEIGSIIASRDGIFKASRYLRHSDIRITSRLYADTKTPVSAGLGAMLAVEKPENVETGEFKTAEKPAATTNTKPKQTRRA